MRTSPQDKKLPRAPISAQEKWINPKTNLPIFTSFTALNLKDRLCAATELYLEGYYETIREAADTLSLPYLQVWRRVKKLRPKLGYTAGRALLSVQEEYEVVELTHRRFIQGHQVKTEMLQTHANATLRANRSMKLVSPIWVRDLKRRWVDEYDLRRSSAELAEQMGLTDRERADTFFENWSKMLVKHQVRQENIWTFAQTRFVIGQHRHNKFFWTFNHARSRAEFNLQSSIFVTTIEAISAVGGSVLSFLNLPSSLPHPMAWMTQELESGSAITATSNGSIEGPTMLLWIEHFEQQTRPSNPDEMRLVLIDGSVGHYMEEIIHFCRLHRIELFPLPPDSTHLVHPILRGTFDSYRHWQGQVLREKPPGEGTFFKTDLVVRLEEARRQVFTREAIKSAWEKCGLFPHNPTVIHRQLEGASSLEKDKADGGYFHILRLPLPRSHSLGYGPFVS